MTTELLLLSVPVMETCRGRYCHSVHIIHRCSFINFNYTTQPVPFLDTLPMSVAMVNSSDLLLLLR